MNRIPITILLIGVAADNAQADSILDYVISFVEASTEAEILSVERELR